MSIRIKLLTVSDLHQRKRHYHALRQAVEKHNVTALLGDFLDTADDTSADKYSTAECARFLSQLPPTEIVCIQGNHETANFWEFAKAWRTTGREIFPLYGAAFAYGPLILVGFPCSITHDTAFADCVSVLGSIEGQPRTDDARSDFEAWLPRLIRQHGAAARAVWLAHQPPAKSTETLSGCKAWRDAIERYSPLVIISGHNHETAPRNYVWHRRFGGTLCVNVGQSDECQLHYCIVESDFDREMPCLPSSIRITAYPWRKSVSIPVG